MHMRTYSCSAKEHRGDIEFVLNEHMPHEPPLILHRATLIHTICKVENSIIFILGTCHDNEMIGTPSK